MRFSDVRNTDLVIKDHTMYYWGCTCRFFQICEFLPLKSIYHGHTSWISTMVVLFHEIIWTFLGRFLSKGFLNLWNLGTKMSRFSAIMSFSRHYWTEDHLLLTWYKIIMNVSPFSPILTFGFLLPSIGKWSFNRLVIAFRSFLFNSHWNITKLNYLICHHYVIFDKYQKLGESIEFFRESSVLHIF